MRCLCQLRGSPGRQRGGRVGTGPGAWLGSQAGLPSDQRPGKRRRKRLGQPPQGTGGRPGAPANSNDQDPGCVFSHLSVRDPLHSREGVTLGCIFPAFEFKGSLKQLVLRGSLIDLIVPAGTLVVVGFFMIFQNWGRVG